MASCCEDNHTITQIIAQRIGIDLAFGDLLPEIKLNM